MRVFGIILLLNGLLQFVRVSMTTKSNKIGYKLDRAFDASCSLAGWEVFIFNLGT